MAVLSERWCGLAIPKRAGPAGRLRPGAGGRPRKEVGPFPTMPEELLALGDWLAAGGVTPGALERPGGSGKPRGTLFAARFTRLWGNAQPVKAGPGRKTAGGAAEGLAEGRRPGLGRGRFVPDRPARGRRARRALSRSRRSLGRARPAAGHRRPKTRAGAPRNLASRVSDGTGGSARAMLGEVGAGPEDAATVAALARGQLPHQRAELARTRTGRGRTHQRVMLTPPLPQIAARDQPIAGVREPIAERGRPFAAELTLRDAIPGRGRWSAAVILAAVILAAVILAAVILAAVILAEIGPALSRCPPAGQLARWAGRCPGPDESAGQRRSGRTRQGSPWRPGTLTEAASAAGRRTAPSLAGRDPRRMARRGKQQTAMAVGRTILELGDHGLTTGQVSDAQPARAGADRAPMTAAQRLGRRWEQRGHRVTRAPAA